MLRLLPGQAAAERAAALAQLDRNEIVFGLCEPGPCEPHQHAALVDPGIETFAQLGRNGADIGQDDHRQLLVEELRDALLRRAFVGQPHIGERRQRAGEVEGWRQQRLRGLAACARDDADGAATPALVEQLHRAGRTLAGDLEPADVVAQLDRQIERRFGLLVLRAEGVAGFADRRGLLVQRAHGAGGDAAVGAQHLHRHFRSRVFCRDQRQRGGGAAFEHHQAAISDGLAEALQKLFAATGVDAVRQPGDLAVAGRFQETIDCGEGFNALDRIGLWRELAQRNARRTRRHQGDVAVRLGQRHQRDGAPVIVGIGDQLVGGPDPDVPVRCGAPAVVEHDHQRRPAAGKPSLRIPDRAGGGENDERRSQEAQRGQPPRRPRGRLFSRCNVEQQARRRKLDAARPRRHHPQQPPQHRQADEADQEQRFGEGERQSHHAAGPALMVVVRAPDLLTCMPACRNSSSSAAERSVECVVNSQSSLLVSARIWSRCSASRAV